MKNFKELNLAPLIQKALEDMNFIDPTPIQAQAIPLALAGRDLIGCAQTGTGKTAAFLIPAMTMLLHKRESIALVLVPTRELAKQIEDIWKKLASHAPFLAQVSLIGGVPMGPQFRVLKKRPRLIVATPGRLIDHLDRRSLDLRNTGLLVLDEADRMLDMGFEPQLSRILKFLPQKRQTLLFSATMPPEAEKLAQKYLSHPERVSVGEVSKAATLIDQSFVETTVAEKNETLLDEINQRAESILVFARTQSRTDRVAKYLTSYGLPVGRIHGGRTQGQRMSALNSFRSGETRILVATDIAARGIDVASIRHVINYDLPMVAEDYIHRIGRTARAGATGEALSLVTPEDRALWRQIQKLLQKSGSSMPKSLSGASELESAQQPTQKKNKKRHRHFGRNKKFGNRRGENSQQRNLH